MKRSLFVLFFCFMVMLISAESVDNTYLGVDVQESSDESGNRAVIYVPADHSTIQAAINASENGDEIIVSPGTYFENLNFNGKAITLGSLFYTTQDTSYISQTIIDGNQIGRVFFLIVERILLLS